AWMQPDEQLRLSETSAVDRAHQHTNDTRVVVIERLARGHQRDEATRRIGADPCEERLARDGRPGTKVAIPVRRAADANLRGLVAMQLDRLLLHDVVPDDDAIGAANGNQLVREVVPARVDDDGANAATDGGPQQRNLGEDQAGTRTDEQHWLI